MKTAALGAGLFLAPLAWFANLSANFALAPLACTAHTKAPLLLVSLAAFVIAILGGALAWSQRHSRSWLSGSGAVISLFSAMVIIAQAIPNVMYGGCE